jgi:hypothetical protein
VHDIHYESHPITALEARGPLFHEAADEFKTMTTTLYQRRTRVDHGRKKVKML